MRYGDRSEAVTDRAAAGPSSTAGYKIGLNQRYVYRGEGVDTDPETSQWVDRYPTRAELAKHDRACKR